MRRLSIRRVCVLVGVAFAATIGPDAAAGGTQGVSVAPATGQAAMYRVIRSTSGSKGRVAGQTFVIEDPRTVFRVPDDRQVIVHFEWDGPAGAHRLEGLWRNPDGRVSTISDFEHTSRGGRFGAYWELALPTGAATGTWTLEARIDGQPAGSHRFEIVAGAGSTAPVAATPTRAPLSGQELYRRIQAATVTVQKLDAAGRVGLKASAFAIAKDRVVVPFNIVDGAAVLRLTTMSGQTEDVTRVVALDRAADWAILPITALPVEPLGRPAAREAGVGTFLYGLAVTSTGERTIYDVSIGGSSNRPELGERLLLAGPIGWPSAGTPVIDAYGDAVAMTGAVWEPGTAFHDSEGERSMAPSSALPMQVGGTALAVPIERIVDDGKAPRDLAALAAELPFTPMFGPSRVHVMRGATAQSMQKNVGFFETVDARTSFSKARGAFAVVLDLMPRDKLASLPVTVTVFNAAGRAIATTKPLALKGDPNRPLGVGWTLDANALQPGLYRLDVGAVGDVMWRTFITITP
ncbi:MAG: hypothetical protein ABIT71_05325 [Vicinamibacteraceae bacterium]